MHLSGARDDSSQNTSEGEGQEGVDNHRSETSDSFEMDSGPERSDRFKDGNRRRHEWTDSLSKVLWLGLLVVSLYLVYWLFSLIL